ncbi:MAG: HDIG domain-containing protein [Candidatus Zixiibacteriota bacterium]|nr:MAG: HDIG domain-containing protein [candidate division Zixibacteria bacterium]
MYRILLRIKRFIKRFLKVQAETRQAPTTGTRTKVYKILMLLLAATLISLLYPAEELFYPLEYPRKGEIAFDDIMAPFQIAISKTPDELEEERQDAADAIPIIIEYDRSVVDSSLSRFDQLMTASADAVPTVSTALAGDTILQPATAKLIDSIEAVLMQRFPFADTAAVRRLLQYPEIAGARAVISDILRNTIYFSGVIPDLALLPKEKTRSAVIRIDNREIYVARDKLLDPHRANRIFRSTLKQRALSEPFDVDFYYDLGRPFIVSNLSVNRDEMQARRNEAMAEIQPYSEIISAGDIVVRAGSQVTEREERILEEIFRQEKIVSGEGSWFKQFMPVVARLLLILASFLIMYLFLYYFHNQIFSSNPKLLAIFLAFGLELTLIYLARMIEVNMDLSYYIYPIAILSILITVLFDAQVGIFNTFILALLFGILHRFNFSLVLLTIVVGTVACYSTQRVRHRTEFFKSALFLALTYVLLILLIESIKVSPAENITSLIGQGLFAAVVSPLLAMSILPVFESLFGFTTDLTLLELSDLNHPLLKRLALEAPGTYHHSILVGNLAEAASKAIEANPLLARVGAYYHDIGKMEIPEYFVENQLGIKSRHEKLTPTMSALILSSHVKKGRLLGEDADLPDEILNFIEEHHGTMLMSYFYSKAKELGVENPNIDEFRYPGPKPRIRETAIVMLADTVEAASRTLAEPKPARIRNLVQNIINDRFQSGELEECPLTLRDLADIRESFVQILIGVFHHRVAYPRNEEE